jgi:hypothetical protein
VTPPPKISEKREIDQSSMTWRVKFGKQNIFEMGFLVLFDHILAQNSQKSA